MVNESRRGFLKKASLWSLGVATASPAAYMLGSHAFGLARRLYSMHDPTEEAFLVRRYGVGEFEAVDEPRRKFALLIGNDDERMAAEFDNTLNLAYDTLRAKGYHTNDIYVLQGKDSARFDGQANARKASLASLIETSSELSEKVTSQDAFFVGVFTHGGRDHDLLTPIGDAVLQLGKNLVVEDALTAVLKGINPHYSVMLFNCCYSGKFALRFGHDRTIAIATSRADKSTTSNMPDDMTMHFGRQASIMSYYLLKGIQLHPGLAVGPAFVNAAWLEEENENKLWNIANNTPMIVYEKINPSNVFL